MPTYTLITAFDADNDAAAHQQAAAATDQLDVLVHARLMDADGAPIDTEASNPDA